MSQVYGEIKPSIRTLMGPGPSNVDPRVLKAMATPLVGHLDPDFLDIMNETMDMLRRLFQTKNTLTIPVSRVARPETTPATPVGRITNAPDPSANPWSSYVIAAFVMATQTYRLLSARVACAKRRSPLNTGPSTPPIWRAAERNGG